VENSASAQLERLGCGAGENGKCDVGLRFFVDTIPDNLRGEFRALTTSKRRIVGVYVDRNGGWVNRGRLDFLKMLVIPSHKKIGVNRERTGRGFGPSVPHPSG